ncbi:uncharacterized protein ACIBXB_000727 [Morphnus guianensis]
MGVTRTGMTGMEVAGTGSGPPVHWCEQPCPCPPATPHCPPAPLSPACPVSPQHSPEAAAGAEAWEYGPLWGCRFHLQPRAGDVCRRRCWHRHMVPTQPSPVAPLFLLEGSPGMEDPAEEDKPAAAERQSRGSIRTPLQHPVPLILCTFQRESRGTRGGHGDRLGGGCQVPPPAPVSPTGPNFFQLRCYIFQALELAPHGTKATAGGTPPPRPPPRWAPRGADGVTVT